MTARLTLSQVLKSILAFRRGKRGVCLRPIVHSSNLSHLKSPVHPVPRTYELTFLSQSAQARHQQQCLSPPLKPWAPTSKPRIPIRIHHRAHGGYGQLCLPHPPIRRIIHHQARRAICKGHSSSRSNLVGHSQIRASVWNILLSFTCPFQQGTEIWVFEP
jgi:hypothetical protein